MQIEWIDQTNSVTENQQQMLSELMEFAADRLQLDADVEMSVTFVDNQTIQHYNKNYRQKDVPTDVISFALEDEVEGEITVLFDEELPMPRNLGDILISVEKAAEQAKEYKHSFERELGFLVVHGFLHLNGYDHMDPDEEKEMFSLQEKILNDYGLKR